MFKYLGALSILLLSYSANAQVKNAKSDKSEAFWVRYKSEKIGKKFNLLDSTFNDVNGKPIEFDEFSNKMFFFGFKGCPPCAAQLPAFFKLATELKDVKFYYVSYDSYDKISSEFKQLNIPEDQQKMVTLISVPTSFLTKTGMVLNYPTKYFVSFKNKVMDIEPAGSEKGIDAATYDYWKGTLNGSR